MALTDAKLRYLAETASLGSMRAASEKLDVAVSSISRQIAQLEADIGLPLIERGRRSIKLTEAGEPDRRIPAVGGLSALYFVMA